jgi:hypothetical protein
MSKDFRDALIETADKGILLTTSSFAMAAKREAIRDGANPIERVDGEKLILMFEKLELGVKPNVGDEVDRKAQQPGACGRRCRGASSRCRINRWLRSLQIEALGEHLARDEEPHRPLLPGALPRPLPLPPRRPQPRPLPPPAAPAGAIAAAPI